MMLSAIIICFGLVLAVSTPASCQDSVFIVANASVPADSLTRKEVSLIFKELNTKWSTGSKIHLAVLTSGNTHERFLRSFLRISAIQYRDHLAKRVFTGNGSYPATFDNEAALVTYVAQTSGAIGYATRRPSGKEMVKIIQIY